MKQPVEGHPNLYKDSESGVIVNRETTEITRYRLARDQARMNQQNSLDLQELRDEMDEIKSLLKQMLNK